MLIPGSHKAIRSLGLMNFSFFSPVAAFSGHQNSSFYIKSSISPDDQFLASGSGDNHTYIWKV